MKFRTEIESVKGSFTIDHSGSILLLGSCFTDNVGSRLGRDGFDAAFNPMGPLYNPASLARYIRDIVSRRSYRESDFRSDCDGIFHCLDFASRYRDSDASEIGRAHV